MGEKPISVIVTKEHRVVIKLVLYDLYILASYLHDKHAVCAIACTTDMPACIIDRLCHDRIPIVFCCDRDFFVGTGFLESSIAIENDQPRVAIGFPYRDKA